MMIKARNSTLYNSHFNWSYNYKGVKCKERNSSITVQIKVKFEGKNSHDCLNINFKEFRDLHVQIFTKFRYSLLFAFCYAQADFPRSSLLLQQLLLS